MRINLKITLVVTSTLITLGVSEISHSMNSQKTTPYGDYCKLSSQYGMHNKLIDYEHAKEALLHYYGEKGLHVEVISMKGRFIKVKVIDGKDEVDTVIFDRRSGRLRSVQ